MNRKHNRQNLIIFTVDGQMEQLYAHSEDDLLKNADIVQEFMVHIMKNEDAREGRWIWKISGRWKICEGSRLEDGDGDEIYDM